MMAWLRETVNEISLQYNAGNLCRRDKRRSCFIPWACTFIYYCWREALNGTLYSGTALLGICFGAQFGVMIPTASELFLLRHFGIIFNFMHLGNPAGAFLFLGFLNGHVYDAKAAKQQSSSCIGPHCFRITFLVLAGLCGL